MSCTYYEKFTVRWSDLDANKHLGNSAYSTYLAQTRVAYLQHIGYNIATLEELNLSPIVLKEEISYYKEFRFGETVYVSFKLLRLSAEADLYTVEQSFYDEEGRQRAKNISTCAWLSSETRKRTTPPHELVEKMKQTAGSEPITTLTMDDVKKEGLKKQDEDIQNILKNINKTC